MSTAWRAAGSTGTYTLTIDDTQTNNIGTAG